MIRPRPIAQPDTRCFVEMRIRLSQFVTPVAIRDLRGRQSTWRSFVIWADEAGLIHSPGRGPAWVLTRRGRLLLERWQRERVTLH